MKNNRRQYSLEELREFIKTADSKSAIARWLGFGYSYGSALKYVNELIAEHNLDISHFDAGIKRKIKKQTKYETIERICPVCEKQFKTQIGNKEERQTCSYACSNTYFRSWDDHPNFKESARTYRKHALFHYGEKCSNPDCELTKAGISIPTILLDVDHVDSNRGNNAIENLQVLCVYCHAKKTRKVN